MQNNNSSSDISTVADVKKDQETKQPTQEQSTEQKHDYETMYKEQAKKLEALEAESVKQRREREEQERKSKEKKGEFENLYKELLEQNKQEKEKNKKFRIESDLKMTAKDAGLKKLEYLSLFDSDGLELSDSGQVIGLSEKLSEFKKKFPEFFSDAQNADNNEERTKRIPPTDNGRISINRTINHDGAQDLQERYNQATDHREKRRILGQLAKQKLNIFKS